jgi:hypothetical protein
MVGRNTAEEIVVHNAFWNRSVGTWRRKNGKKKEGETVSRRESREIRGSQCNWGSARDSTGGIIQAEAGET